MSSLTRADKVRILPLISTEPDPGFMTSAPAHDVPMRNDSPVPDAGDVAPDFSLPSTSGDAVTLSSLRGRPVLLAFFPLAFSSTCTAELCEMRDDWDGFEERGVTVLPISVDSTYALVEYKAKYGMRVDLLSDFKREVTRKYGILHEERFFAKRAYFLVGADGRLAWSYVEDHPGLKRSNAELFEKIDALL